MLLVQIFTLAILFPERLSQKLDAFGRPKCCSDSLSPLVRTPQAWEDTLRQAVYQSVIRHLDYSGTLDGRLARDHALWHRLQRAAFITDQASTDDTHSGALIDTAHSSQSPNFQFHQTDRSFFECSRGECNSKNNSLLTLWQVRRSDNPYALWIKVKLPRISSVPIEDMYEYSLKYGLKKINPDPFQHNSFVSPKGHRFSLPTKSKGEFRDVERVDFRFPGSSKGGFNPGSSKGFGVGRTIPTAFLYDSAISPGKSEKGWTISSALRKPHPGVVVDTDGRNHNQGMPFNAINGQYVTSGPQGFHHIIHSLPSISPPQHLDHPSQQVKGFLPSVRPISAPPPYRTEFTYDPRYVLYYNRPIAMPSPHPTTNFKPSTEFVRYSEVDPIYHPEGETELHQTSPMPMPEYNVPKKTDFPNSINEQLPYSTPPTEGLTNPPFQIIVGEFTPNYPTTQKPTLKSQKTTPPTSTTVAQNKPSTKPYRKTQELFTLQEDDKSLITAFGEKIKPKNSSKKLTPVPDIFESFPTTQIPDIEKKTELPRLKNKSERPRQNNKQEQDVFTFTSPNSNINVEHENHTNQFKGHKTSSTPMVIVVKSTTDMPENSSAEKIEKETTFLGIETEMTTHNTQDDDTSTANILDKDEQSVTNFLTTTEITHRPILVLALDPLDNASNVNKKPNVTNRDQPEIETIISNFSIDETAEANTKPTITLAADDFSKMDEYITITTLSDEVETTTTQNEEVITTNIIESKTSPSQVSDVETQESKQQKVQYRLLTFPGDSVSIVANRISKTVSYKTASGKEKKLISKEPFPAKYRFSDTYKDYSTIL